jgi:hypothetical protein
MAKELQTKLKKLGIFRNCQCLNTLYLSQDYHRWQHHIETLKVQFLQQFSKDQP